MHVNTLASACTVITQILTSTLVTYLQVSVAMKLTQCWAKEEEEEEEEEEEKEEEEEEGDIMIIIFYRRHDTHQFLADHSYDGDHPCSDW